MNHKHTTIHHVTGNPNGYDPQRIDVFSAVDQIVSDNTAASTAHPKSPRFETAANRRIMKILLSSGYVLIAGILFCMGVVMPFLPPPAPSMDPQQLAEIFTNNQIRIQVGSALLIIVCTLFCSWGVGLAMTVARMERGMPILTNLMVALVGGGYVIFILVPMTWGVLALRANTLDPSVIQILNDWVWFLILFTWPPLSMLMLAIAIAIFTGRHHIYPRWVGYLNLWSAMLVIPAGMIVFFLHGPFAYNGIAALWIPLTILASWIVIMTTLALRSTGEIAAGK